MNLFNQHVALPTELLKYIYPETRRSSECELVGRAGLEPAEPFGDGFTVRGATNYALPTHLKMLDSYPFAKSHKRGIISQGIHLNTYHSLCPKNVTKKSDSFVSSSTPSFSATRYWEYTLWWEEQELNLRDKDFQSFALPAELSSRMWLSLKTTPPQAAISGNLIAEVLSKNF